MIGKKNPYLENNRLSEVIAAITALANYRFYKLSYEACAERIQNYPEKADHWKKVLKAHPEFFRVSENRASLVWRRQMLKRYDPKTSKTLSREEYDALTREQKDGISRRPLSAAETTALIETAIKLHERAVEDANRSFWRHPLLLASVGFIGAFIGSWIGG